jgi:hypothetical protein
MSYAWHGSCTNQNQEVVMRKRRELTLPRISADKIAAQLKRGCGMDKARKIANGLAKELKAIGPGDVNPDFFEINDVRKNERIWTQVSHILANQKGYSSVELLICLVGLGIITVSILCVVVEWTVIIHFVRKFW